RVAAVRRPPAPLVEIGREVLGADESQVCAVGLGTCPLAAHRGPDAVSGEPGGLVAATEGAAELVRRHAVRRDQHQVDGYEPLPDGQGRAVEERPGGDAELVAAGVAVPLGAGGEPEQPDGLGAAGAFDATGPAEVGEKRPANLLGEIGETQ